MIPAQFEYVAPTTVEEAVAALDPEAETQGMSRGSRVDAAVFAEFRDDSARLHGGKIGHLRRDADQLRTSVRREARGVCRVERA